MCKAKLAAFTQEERDNAAKTNSQALKELAAGKSLIETGNNSVPRQTPEEGLPLSGSNELVS